MKTDKISLLVQVTIKTRHKIIHDAIAELQSKTCLSISDTPNVKVLETKIIPLKTRN
jgi:hypothetical protein